MTLAKKEVEGRCPGTATSRRRPLPCKGLAVRRSMQPVLVVLASDPSQFVTKHDRPHSGARQCGSKPVHSHMRRCPPTHHKEGAAHQRSSRHARASARAHWRAHTCAAARVHMGVHGRAKTVCTWACALLVVAFIFERERGVGVDGAAPVAAALLLRLLVAEVLAAHGAQHLLRLEAPAAAGGNGGGKGPLAVGRQSGGRAAGGPHGRRRACARSRGAPSGPTGSLRNVATHAAVVLEGGLKRKPGRGEGGERRAGRNIGRPPAAGHGR